VLATGIVPRTPPIPGIDHPKAMGYLDVLRDERPVGKRVAIIGAGGIGFDAAEYLTHAGGVDAESFFAEWGIDPAYREGGGLQPPRPTPPAREVVLMQRKASKVGDGLGKTTGWIHKAALKQRGVQMWSSVLYERIDDEGLHVSIDGVRKTLPVDHVVVCAGQEPQRELLAELQAGGATVHVIGGADQATELDAKRAILQGTRLAASI